MKITNKLFLILLSSASVLNLYAQPSTPPGGGAPGGTTPGAQSIPVDMYVYVLAILAVLMVVFFAKKYKSQKI